MIFAPATNNQPFDCSDEWGTRWMTAGSKQHHEPTLHYFDKLFVKILASFGSWPCFASVVIHRGPHSWANRTLETRIWNNVVRQQKNALVIGKQFSITVPVVVWNCSLFITSERVDARSVTVDYLWSSSQCIVLLWRCLVFESSHKLIAKSFW